ncbi:MAG: proteasome assembly chaperone 4 family protein [Candidatus Bathyarchaeia archaeon]
MSATPRTASKSIEEENLKVSIFAVELSNAIVAFFHDSQEAKLGTLALATPRTDSGPGVSTVFLGDRNTHLARVLAEFCAARFNKLCLAGVHLSNIPHPAEGRILLKLAQAFSFDDTQP